MASAILTGPLGGSDAQTTLYETLKAACRMKDLALFPFPKMGSPIISSVLLFHHLYCSCLARKAGLLLGD